MLATSRVPLDVDGEVVVPLAPLPAARCRRRRPHLTRLRAVPRTAGRGGRPRRRHASSCVAIRICRAVDGVPLAIELAAARARAYSLDEIAAQVTDDASTLGAHRRAARAEHHRTVRFAVEQSYRTLSADEARCTGRSRWCPARSPPTLAAALVARPVAEVRTLLARLVHCSLLVPLGPLGPGRPVAVRAARDRPRARRPQPRRDPRRPTCVRRARPLGRRARGDRAPRLGDAAEPDWFAALDDDLAALRATLQHNLVDAPSALGVRVASRLGLYWYYRGMMVEARQWQERATRSPTAIRSTGPWCGSCSAARWPWRAGATSPCRSSRTAGRSRATSTRRAPRRSAGHPLGRALRGGRRRGLGERNAELVAAAAAATADPTVGLLARLAAALATAATAAPATSSPARPTCTTGRWRRTTPSSPGWPRTRRRTPRWPPATSRTGMLLVGPHGRPAPHAAGPRGPEPARGPRRPARAGGRRPRRRAAVRRGTGAQPARGHALAAAPGHHGAPAPRRRDALDRVAFEDAWQAGARLTLDDLEPALART